MKNIKCKDCGQKNFSSALYCEKCGAEIYKDYIEDKVLRLYFLN